MVSTIGSLMDTEKLSALAVYVTPPMTKSAVPASTDALRLMIASVILVAVGELEANKYNCTTILPEM